jgi:hypothetical protein
VADALRLLRCLLSIPARLILGRSRLTVFVAEVLGDGVNSGHGVKLLSYELKLVSNRACAHFEAVSRLLIGAALGQQLYQGYFLGS